MATETIELRGHIVDSLLLAKVLDVIVEAGVAYELVQVDIGRTNTDPSQATIELEGDQAELDRLVDALQLHGANRLSAGELRLEAADRDGVLPAGFYSTTNLATDVLLDGEWVAVENPEMDCGLILERDGDGRPKRVYTLPMSDVREGMLVITGASGIKVTIPAPDETAGAFGFMESEVSSEKPQAVLVRQVADGMREAKAAGKKVLWVGGPGVVDVKIHLVGNHPQFLKRERPGDLPLRPPRIGPMPAEVVQPLVGLRDVLRRAAEYPASDDLVFLPLINDERFVGIDRQRLLDGDRLVLDRIEPQVGRTAEVLDPAVGISHGEVLMRLGAVPPQVLDPLAKQEQPPRPIDQADFAPRIPQSDPLPAADGFKGEHATNLRIEPEMGR